MHGPAVQQVAEERGHEQTEHTTDGRMAGTGHGLVVGPQEQCRLESLTADGDSGEDGQRHTAAGEGRVHLLVQVTLDGACGATHPEDHPGEEHHREHRHDAGEGLLGGVAE